MNAWNAPQPVMLLDVPKNNRGLREELLAAVAQVIDSGQYIGGPMCQAFEQSVARISQTPFAIGCASGSDALLLALTAVGVGPGDEVLVPSFTFFATASCVTRLGATPVFVDIDPETFNMDPALIPALITPRTKAIIPVHLFGQCCPMDEIMSHARTHGLFVIEDCCQSIAATYKGQPCGSIGDAGCFSFYPTKNLGGFGDGGMVTVNDPLLAEKVRLLANHGMKPRYHHQTVGINSRLDAIQAALLNIKIQQLEAWTNCRRANAQRYDRWLSTHDLADNLQTPTTHPDCDHVWNQYTVRITGGRRDAVRQHLADLRIGTEIYYPIPLHRQACFAYLGYQAGSLPVTEKACDEVLSLPIYPELTADEQMTVVAGLASAFDCAAIHSLERRAAA